MLSVGLWLLCGFYLCGSGCLVWCGLWVVVGFVVRFAVGLTSIVVVFLWFVLLTIVSAIGYSLHIAVLVLVGGMVLFY